jgi:hypothetical protein
MEDLSLIAAWTLAAAGAAILGRVALDHVRVMRSRRRARRRGGFVL